MSNVYWIHGNDGELNTGIGQINADYVLNNNNVMTFYNKAGKEVFWYSLVPGEAMSVDYEDES